MKFLPENDGQKLILVISDLHLSAGGLVNGRRNFLEDFHFDKELVEFLRYYSEDEFASREVELVINGDFFDFLAVPFVNFFDDEFWSEKAALEKLRIIMKAHPEVMAALGEFLRAPGKRVVYILGNHDAELVFPEVREEFQNYFPEETRSRFTFHLGDKDYYPAKGVAIKHGHDYEPAHRYDPHDIIIKSSTGEGYFLPPWGSYYVTRVINKFKSERSYINAVRPIRTFIIYGLIFDTLFTLRFIFANCYYFLMVIFLSTFKRKGNASLGEALKYVLNELLLFQDEELLIRDFFVKNPETKVLVMGHTHGPVFRNFADGTCFINTGTWTKMFNLDFSRRHDGFKLTYAQIAVAGEDLDNSFLNLTLWKGKRDFPFVDFR